MRLSLKSYGAIDMAGCEEKLKIEGSACTAQRANLSQTALTILN